MEGYAGIIEEAICEFPCNELIIASELYDKLKKTITKQAFYKTIGRLSENGALIHLTKGVYYRPKETRFGRIPISENEIANHFLKNGRGILIGYKLYNQRGITTQISKQIEILSSSLSEERKNIQNVCVRRINLELTDEIIASVETLEVLQGFKEIEDLNRKAFAGLITEFAKSYSDDSVNAVLTSCKYKKSTIAFLKSALDYLNVDNSLDKYLSSFSEYSIPRMEEIYEATL